MTGYRGEGLTFYVKIRAEVRYDRDELLYSSAEELFGDTTYEQIIEALESLGLECVDCDNLS